MEELMEELVQESLWDLEAAVESTGEPLDAQGLADFLGDKMMDVSPEYRPSHGQLAALGARSQSS